MSHGPSRVDRRREQVSQALEEARRWATNASEHLLKQFPAWELRTEAFGQSPVWAIIEKTDEWKPDLKTGPHSPAFAQPLGTRPIVSCEIRALMLAVLEDGITCFQQYFYQPSRTNEKLFLEAEEWISPNDDDLFSFNNVCETLGLDPDAPERD